MRKLQLDAAALAVYTKTWSCKGSRLADLPFPFSLRPFLKLLQALLSLTLLSLLSFASYIGLLNHTCTKTLLQGCVKWQLFSPHSQHVL